MRKNHPVEEIGTIFHHAYMYAPTGIAIVSPDDGVWLRVNPSFCKMLGYGPDSPAGAAGKDKFARSIDTSGQ